jgi:hypothetical protein
MLQVGFVGLSGTRSDIDVRFFVKSWKKGTVLHFFACWLLTSKADLYVGTTCMLRMISTYA